MAKKRNISVLLEESTINKIIEKQKETGIFSRSEMVRHLITKALDKTGNRVG